MNRPEWLLIAIGCIAASLNGVQEVSYCIVQTKLVTVNIVSYTYSITNYFVL